MRSVLGLLLLAALLSCDLYSPVEVVAPLCDNATVLSVGPGVQPEISWTGGCRAAWVRVDSLPWTADGLLPVAWQKYSPSATIRSPVRVGVDSTHVDLITVELGRGQLYQACLVGTRDPRTGLRDDVCVPFTP